MQIGEINASLSGTSLYLFLSIATALWAAHYGRHVPEIQVIQSNEHHLSQCDLPKKHLIIKLQPYQKRPNSLPDIGPRNEDFVYLCNCASLIGSTGFRSILSAFVKTHPHLLLCTCCSICLECPLSYAGRTTHAFWLCQSWVSTALFP